MSILDDCLGMLQRTEDEGLTPGTFCTSRQTTAELIKDTFGRDELFHNTERGASLLGRPHVATGVPCRSSSATVDHLIAATQLSTRELVADRIQGGAALAEMRRRVADDVVFQLLKVVTPLVRVTADTRTEMCRAEAKVCVRQFRHGDSVCIQLEFLQDKEAL